MMKLLRYGSPEQILIGDDVWTGTCAIILPRVTVGKRAIVAAGAVVKKELPEYAIVAGKPARILNCRSNG